MSEERKLILQMVADGKISADEAEKLLQAIDESERTAHTAAAESTRAAGGQSLNTGGLEDLGRTIEQAVNESLRGLDHTLRGLEMNLERRLNERSHGELREKIEDKVRRAAEKAVEKAQRAEERAARAAEKAAERAAERAERMAARMEERWAEPRKGERIFKTGIVIDRVTVTESKSLTIPAAAGDRLVLDNRVGDIAVVYYEGSELQAEVRQTVWGEDEADAQARSAATKVHLTRNGSDLVLEVEQPTINAVGVVVLKDTRIDYYLKVPHGVDLQLRNKVGDLRVEAEQVSRWSLLTKVGDMALKVSPAAGFDYQLSSKLGDCIVALNENQVQGGNKSSGHVGDRQGSIHAEAKTGNIRLHY